jgi:glycosyltransferase involved in cell wall biosynthesis
MELAREGLEGAQKIVALSSHSAGTVAEDFPDLASKTLSFPGGVDTELFRPDALDRGVTAYLNGGPGRGPQQRAALREALDRGGDAGDLADSLREIAASYDARSHDADAGDRLEAFLDRGGPLVVYVGKLIHSKGVHSLVSAFARVRRETGARLLVIGFGTFRRGSRPSSTPWAPGTRRRWSGWRSSARSSRVAPPRPWSTSSSPKSCCATRSG